MFSQVYFYCYVLASVLTFALQGAMKKNNPANQSLIPMMGIVGLVTKISGFVFLILCLFYAEHWWHALAMWVAGFALSVLMPSNKVETLLGYLAVAVAPVCILLAYLDLFRVI